MKWLSILKNWDGSMLSTEAIVVSFIAFTGIGVNVTVWTLVWSIPCAISHNLKSLVQLFIYCACGWVLTAFIIGLAVIYDHYYTERFVAAHGGRKEQK
jgi:hypothetical protein